MRTVAGHEPGPLVILDTGETSNPSNPALAVDMRRQLWAAWNTLGPTSDIAYRVRKGDMWSAATQVPQESNARRPALAADANGGMWLFCASEQGGIYRLIAAYFDDDQWSR